MAMVASDSTEMPRGPKRDRRLHAAAVVVHRWVGLVIAVFLIVAGLTGSMMAFYPQLDAELNPELYKVAPPSPGAPLLDPFELRDRIRAQLPKGTEVEGVILHLERDRSVNYWIDDRETFADPYTGRILGTREFGKLSEGRKNALTFLYTLHFSLALGDVGSLIFGIIALLWTLDCFVGAYLTLPSSTARRDTRAKKSWLARWWPAWLLKTNTLFTLLFTWHRASGLWVWGLLLVFAWSAVALNLNDQVYAPVMNAAFGAAPEHEHLPKPRTNPKIGERAALARAERLMNEQAKRRRFEVIAPHWFFYDAEHGAYSYTVESTLDIDQRLAETTVALDGDDGRFLEFSAPGLTARSAIDMWLIALHFGAIRAAGLPYRVLVCALGLVVTLLSITGVWIWLRKRNKRPKSPGGAGPRAGAGWWRRLGLGLVLCVPASVARAASETSFSCDRVGLPTIRALEHHERRALFQLGVARSRARTARQRRERAARSHREQRARVAALIGSARREAQ